MPLSPSGKEKQELNKREAQVEGKLDEPDRIVCSSQNLDQARLG